MGLKLVLFGEPGERPWFNFLLILVPHSPYSHLSGASSTFPLSLLAMLPLAERLGFCTEELSGHDSDTVEA